jgi:hypothetical protein
MSNTAGIATIALTSVGSAASIAATFITGINSKMAAADAATYRQVIKGVAVSSSLLFIGLVTTLTQIILMPGNLPYWAWVPGISLFIGGIALLVNCPQALDRIAKNRGVLDDADVRDIRSARSTQAK